MTWYRDTRWLLLGGALVLVVVTVIVTLYLMDDDGDVEVDATDRSMAALLIDRIPRDATSQGNNWALDHYPKGSIGAIVNFDSDVLALHAVATPDRTVFDRYRCDRPRADYYDGCREDRLDDGSTLRISWEKVEPEEDPGLVTITVLRRDQVVSLTVNGPHITGDPATTDDLPHDLDTFVGIATDPDFGMRTTQDYVDAGEEIDDWQNVSE